MTLREKADYHKKTLSVSPFEDKESFEVAQRMGKLLSFSSAITGDWRGSIANAVVAIDLANKTGIPAMTIANHIYVVHGKVGFSAEFYRAIIHGSGRFDSLLRYEMNKERTECRAYISYRGDPLYGDLYTIEMAKQEGLFSRKGSKWLVNPEMMLKARTATSFARLYVSDIYLGLTNIAQKIVSDENIIDVGVVE